MNIYDFEGPYEFYSKKMYNVMVFLPSQQNGNLFRMFVEKEKIRLNNNNVASS